jgi:hypothetical protein
MNVRLLLVLLMSVLPGAIVGCGQRGGLVYVLEEPQSVTLTASASPSRVRQGATVVLHVERRTSGKWKQIPLKEVRSGQCWVYQPPVELEPEVADSVHWQVAPENAVVFTPEYRVDHTRIARMNVKGTITLTPISPVKCEEDRVVEGSSIQIEVT